MKNKIQTLAEQFIQHRGTGWPHPKPLQTDPEGKEIFEDGSWVIWQAFGEYTHGSYDFSDWYALEYRAFELGKADRLGKLKMSRDHLLGSRIYPKRICEKYREGFFSVPHWPNYSELMYG